MSSAAVGSHSGAGHLSLMSCVRESSPLQDYECDGEKIVASKKRFWNPKKWFKRKNKVSEDVEITTSEPKETLRSRSTSELSVAEDQTRRRSSSSMHQGLSQSHDSVFHSPNSGSDIGLDAARSTSSLSISQPHIDRVQTELSERLRLRRGRGDTSEDDEGLPHSPCNSPTTTEGLLDKTAIKDLPTKSHSTCSDGSLLSMGSSEMDEDSFGLHSRNSSKLSLHEKRTTTETDSDLELSSSVAPLNHSAAHHRVAVRPKRTHGAPRRKKGAQLTSALPVTPEVNEDSSIRSVTPENIIEETYSEILTETQKCSSLPPGLVPPGSDTKLNRSKSNAGSKSQDHFSPLQEEKEEKSDKSFFDRIFPRKSAKKRKSKEEKRQDEPVFTVNPIVNKTETKPIVVPRTGPASRQRIQPIDIPASPDETRRLNNVKMSPERSFAGTSPPFHAELENRFKQRQISPPIESPPVSPKKPKIQPTVISDQIYTTSKTKSSMESRKEVKTESKVKIAGLSSLQQRVLSLNEDDTDNGFKSLTDFFNEVKPTKPVTKSHSFKSTKQSHTFISNTTIKEKTDVGEEKVSKAASLDSIKNLDEPTHQSDFNFTVLKKPDEITISGPSHTAVVNITNTNQETSNTTSVDKELDENGDLKSISVKENQISITKIQLKRETTQITSSTVTVPKNEIPEFLNKQLNKVEARPVSNVVFSMNSPRIIEEHIRPKTLEPITIPQIRKFSQDNLEIVEKVTTTDEDSPITPPPHLPSRFKKNDKPSSRKSSVVSITPEPPKKPFLKNRSISLDSLKNDNSDKSSQDSLDKLDEKVDSLNEKNSVTYRKKSSIIHKKDDDQPELMKVFARRSMKLKDSESDSIGEKIDELLEQNSNNNNNISDKENQEEEQQSPVEEIKKSFSIEKDKENIIERRKSKEEPEIKNAKIPLCETKPDATIITKNNTKTDSNSFIESTEVTLRKSVNNNIFPYQRAVSLNPPRKDIIKTQTTYSENRKTEQWISKNETESELVVTAQEEIILPDFNGKDYLTKPNFNQRKAEWEKRAQQAQKKNVP